MAKEASHTKGELDLQQALQEIKARLDAILAVVQAIEKKMDK